MGALGYIIGWVQLQIPHIIGAALAFAIVVFVLRDRERPVLRELILPTLLAVALTLIDLQWGAVVFGLLIVLPQLVGQGAQLRALLVLKI